MRLFLTKNEFDGFYKSEKLEKKCDRYIYLNKNCTQLYIKDKDIHNKERYSAYSVDHHNMIHLKHIDITEEEISFLNNLILKKENKSYADIRRAARTLAQGKMDDMNSISSLPDEIFVKIASLLGDADIHSKKDAEKIARDNFCKPKL